MNDMGIDASKFDDLYNSIAFDSPDTVKTKITELNTHLLMAHEGMKNMIRPDRFIKSLITHLDNKVDSSLMLQSSNCILSLLDLFPEQAETIIEHDGLKVLESKGQTIEYIDVAEDCIKLLNKIAEQCPVEVLNSN